MPERIQRSRRKGWRMPPDTIYVGRPTKWGNPIKIANLGMRGYGVHRELTHLGLFTDKTTACEFAVNCFRDVLDYMQPSDLEELLEPLRGKNLACWCPIDQPCHADVLLELANSQGE